MWLFQAFRLMRTNVLTFLNLLFAKCRVNGIGLCVHADNCSGRHEYFLTVQPGANVHYEVFDLPISIIEIELLQMTNVSIRRVKPIRSQLSEFS